MSVLPSQSLPPVSRSCNNSSSQPQSRRHPFSRHQLVSVATGRESWRRRPHLATSFLFSRSNSRSVHTLILMIIKKSESLYYHFDRLFNCSITATNFAGCWSESRDRTQVFDFAIHRCTTPGGGLTCRASRSRFQRGCGWTLTPAPTLPQHRCQQSATNICT